MEETPMNTRTKVWSDAWGCAEEWIWNGQTVLRYKQAVSYPWTHRIGEFSKDHARFATNDRDRAMTQDEISAFKISKSARKAA